MDALALLCNLHADGPFTLQRLRRSGCDSLAVLLELGPVQLATHLDGSERTAERFLREAELLVERLEDEHPWERETSELADPHEESLLAPEPRVDVSEAVPEQGLEEGEEESDHDEVYVYDDYEEGEEDELEEDEADDEEGEEIELLEAAQADMGPVLDAWREADRETPPVGALDYVVPRPSSASVRNQALDEIQIDGLDPDLRERLGQLGVLSLKGLVEAPPLELAQGIPLSFTRVKHVQFLARRAWKLRSEALVAPGSYDELVAVERLDASGPFASEPGFAPD